MCVGGERLSNTVSFYDYVTAIVKIACYIDRLFVFPLAVYKEKLVS